MRQQNTYKNPKFKIYLQPSLKVLCACERRFEKNVPAGKVECTRWPDADIDEMCLQKSEARLSVPVSIARSSRRLMSSGYLPHSMCSARTICDLFMLCTA